MDTENGPIGKVLVVGGGVAGVQASLDLAYGGFKTYLLEARDAIGGTMAQLDKTFPTNDCSMCILSPKLVETGSNPNIEILTRSKIIKVEGAAPHFKVTVVTEPRFVDPAQCKGCGDCSKACPVYLDNEYEEMLGLKKAISRRYEQAVPSTFGITKYDWSPCRAACPLHVNAHGYIALIGLGKMEEALALVRERNPFPAITGRICTRPCEKSCTRIKVDESIAIDALKRYVSDVEMQSGKYWEVTKPESNGKKVAIIGAGPAGLLCAFDLRCKGFDVSIHDRMPEVGGMIRYGIPAYRLPRNIIDREVQVLRDLGVHFYMNHEISGTEGLEELKRTHHAVFVATGAWRSKKMNIPGEESDTVYGAVEFLKKANKGEIPALSGAVATVGGGNAAIDAARTVLRLGAKESHIIYRRTRVEMPANPEEIEEAEAEGVIFHYLSNPLSIVPGNVGTLVNIQKMELEEPDESGRRKPIPIPGSEELIPFNLVIMAISQETECEQLPSLSTTKWGTYVVDKDTLATDVPGVFAGGDATLGPATYIEAMACGRKAALSIERYINHEDLKYGRDREDPFEPTLTVDITGVKIEPQAKPILTTTHALKGNYGEVNFGLHPEDVVGEAKRCLNCGGCSECMECVRACEAKAIVHDMIKHVQVLDVGSIILAAGFEETDISKGYSQYGFGIFPNVITSIQFERLLSASGPYGGVLTRPGDKKHPKKIAWLQCIGSRDEKHPYCSSVCCMYATKEAVIAREHSKEVEPTIFFIDIRSYGKEFDKYIDRARDEYGIRFVKSRIGGINELKDGSLKLEYEDDSGKLQSEVFDMVVLSVGLASTPAIKELAETTHVKTNAFDFIDTPDFNTITTSCPGIFAAGAIAGPKDIPESVTEGSAAANLASAMIASERGKEVIVKNLPPEINVIGDKPRVGVFVCHCGLNIGGFLDVNAVSSYISKLPFVVYSETNLYTCSADTQEKIREKIKEFKLNRVVVASCTPRTHEPLFQETIREAGLNRNLFELANIRDQDSWVHQTKPEEATEKAKYLVKAAVYRVLGRRPLTIQLVPVTHKGLVIGGGIAGMNAALSIANQGYETYLVEKESQLGGNGRYIHFLADSGSVDTYLADLIQTVRNHPLIKTRLSTEVKSIDGYVGNFKTILSNGITIEHGVIVVATGAEETKTEAYGMGRSHQVITGRELEERLAQSRLQSPKSVVFIQCVESRDEKHPYCSRICCQEAVKNALKIKEVSPSTEVYILNRDVRTYGYHELLYRKAREKGVVFIRFEKERKPEVFMDNGNVCLEVFDSAIQREIELKPDLLVLSTGITANPGNFDLAKFLKVPLTQDGFFLEAHAKLRPVDFATDGIFLAGLAHSPRNIEETIVQAQAAAGKASIILAKEAIEAGGKVAFVNERNCSGCGTCEEVCAYSAVEVKIKKVMGQEKRVAEVNATLCKGCGACTAGCRSSAIDIEGFTNEEISDAVDALLEPI
jgi:heterodisulfide reductase subunit A-like polyferredoxin